MGVLDILILALVAAGAALAIRWVRRHGLGCGGDCAHCGRSCCEGRKKGGDKA